MGHEDGSQSIYRSKAFLDQSKLFWTCPNMFGRFKKNVEDQTKKQLFGRTLFHILNHIQNMSCPKQFGRIQNSLEMSKIVSDL